MVCGLCQEFAAMTLAPAKNVTPMLWAAQSGDKAAAAQLLTLVYDELHKLAQDRIARLPPGQSLQPTALVHEVYLRLIGKRHLRLENRRQFFFVAARAMRDILVEQARRKAGPKRGGGRRRIELNERVAIIQPPSQQVEDLHEALGELEHLDPLKARIVDLRYFAGMSMKEAATVLDLSERTLHRHWRFIKAWLKRRLAEPE
jgi:RNA polymerase sigma factor (TIGR02999 family)